MINKILDIVKIKTAFLIKNKEFKILTFVKMNHFKIRNSHNYLSLKLLRKFKKEMRSLDRKKIH